MKINGEIVIYIDMKVGEVNKVSKALNIKKKSSTSAAGGFSFLIDSGEETKEPAVIDSAQAVPSLGNVFAAQALEYDKEQAERQIKRGNKLLDSLEELRLNLLEGRINPYSAGKLLDNIKQGKEEILDPKLAEIIDEIELRVEVEIAKLGM